MLVALIQVQIFPSICPDTAAMLKNNHIHMGIAGRVERVQRVETEEGE